LAKMIQIENIAQNPQNRGGTLAKRGPVSRNRNKTNDGIESSTHVADCTGNRVRNAALQPLDLVRADELLVVPCACSDRRKSRQSWSTLRPRIVFGNYSSISRMLSLTLRRISVVLGG
jgi:hypothetical protein